MPEDTEQQQSQTQQQQQSEPQPQQPQHRLLSLPIEVLQNVLENVDPADLGSLSKACRSLNSFIGTNNLLWKGVYLNSFDGPPARDVASKDIKWKDHLQSVVSAQKVLASDDEDLKRSSFISVALTLITLLRTARSDGARPSRNVQALRAPFKDEANQNVFLCSSSLFARAGTLNHQPFESEAERQLSAQLHCLYGAPRWGWGAGQHAYTHPYARARVYDIRRFTSGTLWGPFVDDHSSAVDWEKMEAIMTVLGYNLNQLHLRSNGMFDFHWHDDHGWLGASPHSFHPPLHVQQQPGPPLDDPYAVTGKYLRIVCFLDYFEFFSFNFRSQRPYVQMDREPLDTTEATRLITMTFRVTDIRPPGPEDHKDMPVVHFKGKSRAMVLSANDDNGNSDVIGTVRTTKFGEVRWTTFSVYGGEQRWRSEGIQVGGVQSARGVIGNWFDKDFDPHGPAGPTAFWKTNHEVQQSEDA